MDGINLKYRINGELIRESLLKIVRLVMTFYNHIPNTSYFAIPEFEAPRNEGPKVKASLNQISSLITTEPNTRTEQDLAEVVGNIVNLIHLPEIIDVIYEDKNGKKITKTIDETLGEHRAKTLSDGAKKTKARDNSKDELVSALAKHMHIIFAIYPELEQVFNRELLIKSFIEKFIEGRNGDCTDMGWPSFINQKDKDQICELVKEKLKVFEEKTQKKHYTSYEKYKNLVSSDDEEETTEPRVRIAKPKAETLQKTKPEVVSPDEAILKELADLRRFKKIIETKTTIPNSLIQQLKSECPSLYKGRGTSL